MGDGDGDGSFWADFLFETDFVNSDMEWPRAEPGFMALAHAAKLVEEEIERDKRKVLKIPMKRMATMDKQLGMAERLLGELMRHADDLDRAAQEESRTQRARAEKSLGAAEHQDILQTI